MSRLNSAVRGLIRSKQVQAAAMASGVAEEFASAYVAGDSVDDAIAVANRLRAHGLLISLAYLPTSDDEAETPGMLCSALGALGDLARDAEVSVKPSSLGLRVDAASAASRLDELCTEADGQGAHVTLEMQGTGRSTQATIDLWHGALTDHPRLGITLPSDIRRSERDVERLAVDGARVRLCVGSYPFPGARPEGRAGEVPGARSEPAHRHGRRRLRDAGVA